MTSRAEKMDFPENSFDVITACQCIWYLEHSVTAPEFAHMLKSGGSFLILYMGWLPFADRIAEKSEALILKYNPAWTGGGDTKRPIRVPDVYMDYFDLVSRAEFYVDIPFTREGWHGRMRACRGIGASMTDAERSAWEKEHYGMLMHMAPERFTVKHYIAIAELRVKK